MTMHLVSSSTDAGTPPSLPPPLAHVWAQALEAGADYDALLALAQRLKPLRASKAQAVAQAAKVGGRGVHGGAAPSRPLAAAVRRERAVGCRLGAPASCAVYCLVRRIMPYSAVCAVYCLVKGSCSTLLCVLCIAL